MTKQDMKEKKGHRYGKAIVFRYGAYRQCFECGYQAVSERDMYKTPCNPIFVSEEAKQEFFKSIDKKL